jgi:hypothetical protein
MILEKTGILYRIGASKIAQKLMRASCTSRFFVDA